MTSDGVVRFPLSRSRTVLGVLGSAAFVAVGAFLFTQGADRPVLAVAGVLAVVTFGLFGVLGVRQLLRRDRTGLAFDDEGFTDTSAPTAVGRVAWAETTGLRTGTLRGQPLIVVDVVDPDAVVARLGSATRRASARANIRLVGSPVCLSAGNVAATEAAVLAAFERFGSLRAGYSRGPEVPDTDVDEPTAAG
jgi:hypothetical protein